MNIVCLDLEGVLMPEVWIAFAEKVGVEELRATTRDIPDYDELMQFRLQLLAKHQLKWPQIEAVIAELEPLPGAESFLQDLRRDLQLIILSDTFEEFARPMMQKLDWPTIFCHRLEIDAEQNVTGYRIRKPDHKRETVTRLQQLNFHVIAAGDSYNDTSMLKQADHGFLFQAPDRVAAEFPQFSRPADYHELRRAIDSALI